MLDRTFMRHFRISAYPRPPPAACMSVTTRGTDVLEPGAVLLQDGTWLTAPVRCNQRLFWRTTCMQRAAGCTVSNLCCAHYDRLHAGACFSDELISRLRFEACTSLGSSRS